MLRQVITALIPNGLQVYACEVPVPNFGEKVAMGLAAQYVPPEVRSVGDREISWGMLESPFRDWRGGWFLGWFMVIYGDLWWESPFFLEPKKWEYVWFIIWNGCESLGYPRTKSCSKSWGNHRSIAGWFSSHDYQRLMRYITNFEYHQ